MCSGCFTCLLAGQLGGRISNPGSALAGCVTLGKLPILSLEPGYSPITRREHT